MSYDLDLYLTNWGVRTETLLSLEPTYNVGPMFRLALGSQKRDGTFDELEERSGHEIIPILERAVAHINDPANDSAYKALNPSNGWGNVDTARITLEKLLSTCREYPNCMFVYRGEASTYAWWETHHQVKE